MGVNLFQYKTIHIFLVLFIVRSFLLIIVRYGCIAVPSQAESPCLLPRTA